MTLKERMYTVFIDTLVVINNHTVKVRTHPHDCKSERIKCDMLERECGAPWSLLIEERRQRLAAHP